MTNFLEIARKDLLDPAGLTDNQLQKILSNVLGNAVDNLIWRYNPILSRVLEDGIIKMAATLIAV